MDKYPVVTESGTVGELAVFQEGQDTVFQISCPDQTGLWCGWAVGAQGTLRIGVLRREGKELFLRRRFSRRMTARLGPLRRGEVRMVGEKCGMWKSSNKAEKVFHTLYLRQKLTGKTVFLREMEGRREIAIPQAEGQPFPLEAMFCFARWERVERQFCWVFAFDWEERPLF